LLLKLTLPIASLLFSTCLFAQPVSLVASSFSTFVDNEGEPARLNAIVAEAFSLMKKDVDLAVMRQAFLGSELRARRADGEFAYLDLGDRDSEYYYSKAYLPLHLYVASKKPIAENIKLLPHLNDKRVAIENRFANTPTFRRLKEIKWSRNPSSYDAFKQIADDRAPLLLSSRLLIDELNRLVQDDNEEILFLSPVPLLKTGVHLSLHKDSSNAKALIDGFEDAIDSMQYTGRFNVLLGLSWLTKDINGDGVADFIGSKTTTSQASLTLSAHPLDKYATSEQSLYVIDGVEYTSLDEANRALPENLPNRASFLDPEVYKRILQRW
jgi:ABC-type amino acid transport substrate-binding protein